VIRRAVSDERGLGGKVVLEPEAEDHLIRLAGGDARRSLTALEAAADSAVASNSGVITLALLESTVDKAAVRYDRDGDQHYDVTSAFIKSIRGSDVDAALHYLARMIEAGEDPRFIARRLAILASEDIGNADPRALTLALAAWDSYDRLGSPEGELALAQACIFLALAPKSNAVYMAFGAAMEDAKAGGTLEVPLHLRNAPTRLMRELGYGKGYRYAHDEPGALAPGQTHFPDAMAPRQYYDPVPRGLELKLRETLERIRQAALARARASTEGDEGNA
jgi:putative ATPase